jgi:acyl-CoA synthetase (AMP-forming)/AMP-acid ligase II
MDVKELQEWDLSSVEALSSGGEPVDHDVMKRLLPLLQAHCNLSKDAFAPSYGLAEGGASVTFNGKQLVHIERDALYSSRKVQYVKGHTSASIAVYGCGEVKREKFNIVDGKDISLGDDQLGEIWISSPELARQYIESDKTCDLNCRLGSGEDIFWMATDDLGFIHNDELFVLGRKSGLIFLGGKSIFPHHIEALVNTLSNFRKGNTTAYVEGDNLAIAVEVKDESRHISTKQKTKLADLISTTVSSRFEVHANAVVVHFMPPRSAIRTSSGKLERLKTGAAIREGDIKVESFEMVCTCEY